MKGPPVPETAANDRTLESEVQRKLANSSEADLNASFLKAGIEESVDSSSAPSVLACSTCNRKFQHEKDLWTHQKNNKDHPKAYECAKCGREFESPDLLLRHQSLENHLREKFHVRRTGPFSETEKQKLQQFKMSYCDTHGIDETVFRQMMTDSSRPGWVWPGVTKLAFRHQYFNVLPERTHKSMLRYKERYFQNLDHNKEWTKEDDKLLLDLVSELGPKWIEIGLRLNRTQDSVTQRYKKKLKNGDAAQSGRWSDHENDALAKAVREVKIELGLDGITDADDGVPWFEVSKRIGGIRTAQQCSEHWHRVCKSRKEKDSREGAKLGGKKKRKEFVSEKILETEGQSLVPLTAPDTEDSIPGSQRIQASEKAEVVKNSHGTSSAKRRSGVASSKASRHPLNKTPGRVMDLSQVFNETQAPSSPLRPATPRELQVAASSSPRPSPVIEIKLRPDWPQDPGPSPSKRVRHNSAMITYGRGMRHNTEIQENSDSSGESDTEDRLAFNTDVIEDEEIARVNGDAEGSGADGLSGETDTSGEYEGEEDNTEPDSDTTTGREEDEGNDDSNDSMVKDTHNDFMANVKESATYLSQRTSAAPRKIIEVSDDDSE
jgi:hypothetical protein